MAHFPVTIKMEYTMFHHQRVCLRERVYYQQRIPLIQHYFYLILQNVPLIVLLHIIY